MSITATPYRSAPVQHVVRLSEAEVKEAIRIYVDNRSEESFPPNGTEVLLDYDHDAFGGAGTLTAEVVGPMRNSLNGSDDQR